MAESIDLERIHVDKMKTLQKEKSKALIDFRSSKPLTDYKTETYPENNEEDCPTDEQTTITWKIRHNHTLELLKLKKQQESVGLALKAKKQEFAERMEFCSTKRIQLTKRRQKFEEYVAGFRNTLEESRVHTFVSLQRAKAEKLEISKKDEQLVELKKELMEANRSVQDSKQQIQRYKPMMVYFHQVKDLEQMSGSCLDNNIPVCEALMRRYEALKQANRDLKKKNQNMLQELTQLQVEQKEEEIKHCNSVMMLTSQLSELRRKLDKMVQTNLTREKHLEQVARLQMSKHQTVQSVLTGIENISRLCKDSKTTSLRLTRGKSVLDQQVRHIQEFIIQKDLVVSHALKEISSERVDSLSSFTYTA